MQSGRSSDRPLLRFNRGALVSPSSFFMAIMPAVVFIAEIWPDIWEKISLFMQLCHMV
jgi:hypothetical protein